MEVLVEEVEGEEDQLLAEEMQVREGFGAEKGQVGEVRAEKGQVVRVNTSFFSHFPHLQHGGGDVSTFTVSGM